jgi:branched-subunit amino acid aminotransferase/4-amino-4-deoxychorismate lyase
MPILTQRSISVKNLGYYNGKIGLIEEMSVPMNDRAGYFGDGIYDATYSRNHIIYALDEHIDRFLQHRWKGAAPDPTEVKKAAAALQRRGFSWSDVRSAMTRYTDDTPED